MAVGYGSTRLKASLEDSTGKKVERRDEPRGAYTVFGKTVLQKNSWFLRDGSAYLGIGSKTVDKTTTWNDAYAFLGYQQQLFRNVLVTAELDDIFREHTLNTGVRVALNAVSSVEFSFTHLFEKRVETDRSLRFTYYLTY